MGPGAGREWVIARAVKPNERVADGALVLRETVLRAHTDGELLVRVIWLSIDPANRVWLTLRETYMPALQPGDVMRGVVVAIVEDSAADGFTAGDLVTGVLGWQERAVVPAASVERIDPVPGLPLDAYVALLSVHGLTAWLGIVDRLNVKSGETVLVSGAAGATGSIAGQLAHARGARVIGIAGGPRKCNRLVADLGFDEAIDYKNEDVGEALRRLCPDGVDAYYDNVGGDMLDAAIENLNLYGRILIAGQTAAYVSHGEMTYWPAPKRWSLISVRRATVYTLVAPDEVSRSLEAFSELSELYRIGEMKYQVHLMDDLESAPRALDTVLEGGNHGKMAIKVSDPPLAVT